MPENKHAVFLDTPILTAIKQISPFYESGIFNVDRCNLYIRRRPLVQVQRIFTWMPKDLGIQTIPRTKIKMPHGNVVFYPFNAQSNLNAVTQRDYRHVLTLHGESGKIASFRPAARIYDYVCVAGPLAIDRYLANGIFTKADVDGGRLVQMGDSFVQRMRWIRPADPDVPSSKDSLLYCPTWEGFGGNDNNYSSITSKRGFAVVIEAARTLNIKRVVIKPHPYFGLLRPSMWRSFTDGVNELQKQGIKVLLAIDDSPSFVRAAIGLLVPKVSRYFPGSDAPLSIRLGITDVSGMEAVLLAARIPAVVTHVQPHEPYERLKDITPKKAISADTDIAQKIKQYIDCHEEIDDRHRNAIFGWQDPCLPSLTQRERLDWLIAYVQKDPFWAA